MQTMMKRSFNSVEKVTEDPKKIFDGMIWFNTTEQVYKCVINNRIEFFLNNADIREAIEGEILDREFEITFENVNEINIKHNKDTTNFIYRIYDTDEQCEIRTSVQIIDSNEFTITLVDPITGSIYIKF